MGFVPNPAVDAVAKQAIDCVEPLAGVARPLDIVPMGTLPIDTLRHHELRRLGVVLHVRGVAPQYEE